MVKKKSNKKKIIIILCLTLLLLLLLWGFAVPHRDCKPNCDFKFGENITPKILVKKM